MKVNVLEARNNLSQLIRSAQEGQEVLIANRGQPVVRLVPVAAEGSGEAARGDAKALLAWLNAHPLPAYLQREHADIESGIQTERAAWD